MAEFNQLIALVDSIVERKHEKEEAKTTRIYESIERQKVRNFEKEMRELGQQYDLKKTVMSEQIKITNEAEKALDAIQTK